MLERASQSLDRFKHELDVSWSGGTPRLRSRVRGERGPEVSQKFVNGWLIVKRGTTENPKKPLTSRDRSEGKLPEKSAS